MATSWLDILRRAFGYVVLIAASGCAKAAQPWDWGSYQPPDWSRYQAETATNPTGPASTGREGGSASGRFTFRDLQQESDRSLAQRLLGENGKRIVYIDRHRERWSYYSAPDAPVESIDLYTHPEALGSAYGICGVEKYTFRFDEVGHIEAVEMSQRYGVEGPVFQKEAFDWNFYRYKMCATVPAAHAPSYFPVSNDLMVGDVVELLVPIIDLSGSSMADLPFDLRCRSFAGKPCDSSIRTYLAKLRLKDIDAVSSINCSLEATGPKDVCFTLTVGRGRLGPFPKHITVSGSNYLHRIRVDSVEIAEGQTVA